MKALGKQQRGLRAVSGYPRATERSLGFFLALSMAVFAGVPLAATFLPNTDSLPKTIQVELGVEGIEGEPPPLGTPEAGNGEETPEQPADPEPPQPPEPEPQKPEPVPEVLPPEPEKAPEPEFVVPKEEPEPEPKPAPEPAHQQPPEPKRAAKPQPPQKPIRGSGIEGARAGVRGSPAGVPGGRGGGSGDFVATPTPTYDATARQRGYQGRGVFVITYDNGRIVSVTTAQSTGVPYLDARSTAWVKANWRVKPGVSGVVSLPINWKLH